MFHFRSFRNTDPPVVTSIWRSRSGQQGLAQPVSVDLLEQLVFGKQHFDYPGMILAWDDREPIGFAHAGFGPNDQRTWVSSDRGVISLLLVRPDYAQSEAPAELLARAERYLRDRGAKEIFGGGFRPYCPFYLGLYGGSELPGVLKSDEVSLTLYPASGYQEYQQTRVIQRDLSGFRPLVDREQMQLRRAMALETVIDASGRDWWEASTVGDFDLTRFDLRPRGSQTLLGCATFRAMDAVGSPGPTRRAGLIELWVDPARRGEGLATYLLGEAMLELSREGYSMAEAQVTGDNAAAWALYQKLGFQQTDEGVVFWKEAGSGGRQ
jgi:ribosomal protein S18 acetylase RimI-like enzyme